MGILDLLKEIGPYVGTIGGAVAIILSLAQFVPQWRNTESDTYEKLSNAIDKLSERLEKEREAREAPPASRTMYARPLPHPIACDWTVCVKVNALYSASGSVLIRRWTGCWGRTGATARTGGASSPPTSSWTASCRSSRSRRPSSP